MNIKKFWNSVLLRPSQPNPSEAQILAYQELKMRVEELENFAAVVRKTVSCEQDEFGNYKDLSPYEQIQANSRKEFAYLWRGH